MRLSIQVKHFIIKLIKYDSIKVKYFVVFALVCSVTFYSWLFRTILCDRMKNDSFLGLHKCPACYGTSLCPQIKQGNIRLQGWSQVGPLDFVNVKNVHNGLMLNNNKKVVLKKLGRHQELKAVDAEICTKAGYARGCDITEAVRHLPLVTVQEVSPGDVRGMSDLMACPSQRLVDLVLDKYQEDPMLERRVSRPRAGELAWMYLATTLMVNPEPLIMQVFPAAEGWPFPQYMGACGQLVVAADVGPSLLTFYSAPWQERVDYAYQVMRIADKFTENDSGFALYWTDLNHDNLAVNADGKVVIVDLENIIVVDKSKIKREKRPGWDVPYLSEYDVCPRQDGSCVSFSVDSLCTRYTVDFNYYTACRNLLSEHASDPAWSGGLLHDLPTEVDTRLRTLLNECSKPSTPHGRLNVKDQLINTLHSIRNDVL